MGALFSQSFAFVITVTGLTGRHTTIAARTTATAGRAAVGEKLYDLDGNYSSTVSHDYDKFNYVPVCSLTDEQSEHLLGIVDQLVIIANHTNEELPHRYQALLAQLAVGYEFLNYYRREQDRNWTETRNVEIFNHFCDLVVKHYRESREVKYYADLLNLTPKHLSKVIRAVANISPAEWIERYFKRVTGMTAKHYRDSNPSS